MEPEQHLRNWQAQGSFPQLTAGPQRPLVCLPLTLASSSVDVRKCWTHRTRNTAPDKSQSSGADRWVKRAGGCGPWSPGEVQRRGLTNHAWGLCSSGEVPLAGNQEKFLAARYLLSSARKRWSCPHLHRRCVRCET